VKQNYEKIDSTQEKIVGINKYKAQNEDSVNVRQIDNTTVRNEQIAKLNKLKRSRDSKKVELALNAISQAAKTGKGNLLELAVEAAKQRATLGEISYAMEKIWGRYKSTDATVKGAYTAEFGKNKSITNEINNMIKMIEEFTEKTGRRPRIMIAKMGQDGHDRGAKVIATGFADMGFDVDVGPLFQTPAEVAQQAIDADVHCVGVSSLAAGHTTLVPQLINELKLRGAGNIVVVVGGVVPPQDYQFLYDQGVAAIFGPGTRIPEAAALVLKKVKQN